MTLKARNRILTVFFILALLDAALNTGLFIRKLLAGSLSFPEPVERQLRILDGLSLLGYEPTAVCAATLAFNAYVLIITLVLYRSFEKTQALEAIYFLAFLLSCMAESTRLLIPAYSLAQDNPAAQGTISRIVIGARLLAPLSFLFAELFSDTESRLFVERNLLILLLSATFMGLLMPLDTESYASTFTFCWGLRGLFRLARVLVVILTLLAIASKLATNYSAETIHEGIGYLISIGGYFLLGCSDNYILLAVGITGLFAGTLYYLHSMHQIYRWR